MWRCVGCSVITTSFVESAKSVSPSEGSCIKPLTWTGWEPDRLFFSRHAPRAPLLHNSLVPNDSVCGDLAARPLFPGPLGLRGRGIRFNRRLALAYIAGLLGSAVERLGTPWNSNTADNLVAVLALATVLLAVLMIVLSRVHWFKGIPNGGQTAESSFSAGQWWARTTSS